MRKLILVVWALLMIGISAQPQSPQKGLDIYWCDVEGGAATLIVTPAGESILVDSGWPGERDAARIAKIAREVAGLKQIDHHLTSHWHTDHFGGISALVQRIPVKNFYDHGFPALPVSDIPPELVEAYKRVTAGKTTVLRPGDGIRLKQAPGSPPVSLKVVASHGVVLGEKDGAPQVRACSPEAKHEARAIDTSDNARSLAFVLSFGDWQFFDAGDLTWNVEHKLVCPRNLVGTVDVYQVTHHGMDIRNNPALVEALRPRVPVMNNGASKGGSPAAVRIVKASPGLQGFFALHRNIQSGPEDNASPELTANDEEQCKGEYVKLAVGPDSKSYTVSIPSKGTTRSYTTARIHR